MTVEPDYIDKGAIFSDDRKYRYRLWRTWDNTISKKPILFLMLNPSTADENVLDPTVRRCLGYAMNWGYGRMDICNIFALRSTDPKELYNSNDPIGPENDVHIIKTVTECDRVIAAWGNHGAYKYRSNNIRRLLSDNNNVYALSLTKINQPVHPLYQKSGIVPVRYL